MVAGFIELLENDPKLLKSDPGPMYRTPNSTVALQHTSRHSGATLAARPTRSWLSDVIVTPLPPHAISPHGFPGPYARSLVCASPAKLSLSS